MYFKQITVPALAKIPMLSAVRVPAGSGGSDVQDYMDISRDEE
ncbi:MAG: hypothetical protein R2860_15450 [Desulfobacterales bacterium]